MQPQSAGHAHDAASPTKATTERIFSPLTFALDRLFPKRGNAPYTATERLVVLVIVRATTLDRSSGDFNCFLSYSTIAKRAGVSVASIKRALQKHSDGPAPLLYRSMVGETRGHRHACYRFTLVRHPEQFARARDSARATHRERVSQALRDLQPDRIALQRQRKDLGGTLTHAEYRLKLAALERAARGKLPARATLKRPPSSS
jgi:DNA-binding transcriptional MerR regulator